MLCVQHWCVCVCEIARWGLAVRHFELALGKKEPKRQSSVTEPRLDDKLRSADDVPKRGFYDLQMPWHMGIALSSGDRLRGSHV